MMSRRSPRSFAVWSHINGANQGDDLVVHSVIEALRKRSPACNVLAVSMYPPDTERRHGVKSLRIGSLPTAEIAGESTRSLAWLPSRVQGSRILRRARNLWHEVPASTAAFRALRKVDLLIIAGSGPLEDDPGSAYRVFKWTLLARLAGAGVAFASVGAGPLDRPVNRMFIRRALTMARYVTVRDPSSLEVVRQAGFRGDVQVTPDMAFGFPIEERGGAPVLPPAPVPTIGLNIMSLNAPRRARGIDLGELDETVFDDYLDRQMELAAHLLSLGYRVVLFSSEYNHDVAIRRHFLRQFATRWPVLASSGQLWYRLDDDSSDFLGTVASCDLVVATRFHSALFSLLSGKPVVGLVYHQKTRDLLDYFGLGDYAFDVEEFAVAQIVAAIHQLRSSDRGLAEKLLRAAQVRRLEVEAQFDRLVQAGDPLARVTQGHFEAAPPAG